MEGQGDGDWGAMNKGEETGRKWTRRKRLGAQSRGRDSGCTNKGVEQTRRQRLGPKDAGTELRDERRQWNA